MTYLICQMICCLLIAALLGFLLGWWLRGRRAAKHESDLTNRIARTTRELAECKAAGRRALIAARKVEQRPDAARADAASATPKTTKAKPAAKAATQAATKAPAAKPKPASKPASKSAKPAKPAKRATAATVDLAAIEVTADDKPASLMAKAPKQPDDLKQIKGVGPKLETMLNGLGIYTFEQISEFSAREVAWVNDNLTAFKGRIVRDDWVGQAAKLK